MMINDSDNNSADFDPLAPSVMNTEEATSAPENIAPIHKTDPRDEKIKALESELAGAKDQTLRALAELENLRKRTAKEREDAGAYAIAKFARDLLNVSDNLRRALAAVPADLPTVDARIPGILTGIEATERTLMKTFELNGIKKIEPLEQRFDPNFHEVMFEAPMPGKADGTVIQVIEDGYVLKERLLRAAKVGIVKNPTSTAAPAGKNHIVDEEA
jgi:molecular chaperone GrpE